MPLEFILTTAGKAKIIAANNNGTNPVTISQIAVGSASWTPTAAATSLNTEIKRITAIGGGVVADDTIHVTASDSSPDTYEVKEVGLYLSDGTLLAVYSQPATIITKGVATVALFAADLVLTGVPAGSVTDGDSTFDYPPATETVKGVLELATTAEAQAGTDATRAITPKTLQDVTATETRKGVIEIATTAEILTGSDTERAITPAGLTARTASTSRIGLVALATDAEAEAGIDSDSALTPSNLASLKKAIFASLYPVGEILITRRSGNPSSWLGFGTWTSHAAGRALVGVDASDAYFAAVDYLGGEKTHSLTGDEMPSHVHLVDPPVTTTTTDGIHGHEVGILGSQWSNDRAGSNATGGADSGKTTKTYATNLAGGHGHIVNIPAFNSAPTGNNQPHNNLQPYITVNVWRRTA